MSLSGEEELDGHKMALVELVPRSEEVRKQITKIVMWVDEASWMPVQQKFLEAGSGDYFDVALQKCNEEFEDRRWKVQSRLAEGHEDRETPRIARAWITPALLPFPIISVCVADPSGSLPVPRRCGSRDGTAPRWK